MTTDLRRPCRLRFGTYELDARTGELWREGAAVRLPPQPFKVLYLLACRRGEVVSREEIRQELWGHDTFVDFDGGLNFCINQIRKALRDSAGTPRFIHTLPRRGYRFIAPVEILAVGSPAPEAEAASDEGAGQGTVPVTRGVPGDEPDEGGGTPRAGVARLYEVVAGSAPSMGQRWSAGRSALVRLRASPVVTEEAAARPEDPPAMPQLVPAEAPPPPFPRGGLPHGGRAWPWVALAVLLVGAATIALARHGHGEAVYERLTFQRGTISSARFSPGGDVAYSASWDGGERRVYVVRPGTTVARAVEHLPERTLLQSVLASGDLAVLLVREPSAVLALAPAEGGTPREVADMVGGADLSPDGARVAAVRGSGPEARVELPLGHEIYRTTAKVNGLRLSPAGDRVAFLEQPVPGDDRGSVVTVDADGQRTVLSPGWASLEGLAWAPGGREVWFTGARVGADSTLNAVTLAGTERVITRGPGRLVLHDIRADGSLLLERTTRRMELRGRFPDTDAERDLSWLDLSFVTDIAADGRALVFSESGEGGGAGYGVFLRRTDGAPPVRLGEGRAMGLSPDGRWVLTIPLFGAPRVVALPTGAGESRALGAGLARQSWAGWFPDSRRIVFTAAAPGQTLSAFVQDLDGGPARPIAANVSLTPCLVTPDGRRVLARTAGATGRWALYPVDGGPPVPVPLATYDRPLTFTPDGEKALVMRPWRKAPLVVDRVDLGSGAREAVMEISAPDPAGVGHTMPPVVTPDGRYYAYSVHRVLSDLYLVHGLS